MLEFQKETNSLLNNSVQVNGTHLVFVMPAESEHLYKLLVYVFLGRILHEEQSNSANSADYNTNKWMMFDSNSYVSVSTVDVRLQQKHLHGSGLVLDIAAYVFYWSAGGEQLPGTPGSASCCNPGMFLQPSLNEILV